MALQAGLKKGGAAKGELVLAIFELANCFRHGWGIPRDPVAAKQVGHLLRYCHRFIIEAPGRNRGSRNYVKWMIDEYREVCVSMKSMCV